MVESPDSLLLQFLNGRDVPCPSCSYNLRELRETRCPECGEELVLRVGLVDPRQAAVVAGLIGLAAGVGLSGPLLIYAAIRILIFREGHNFGTFLTLTVTGLIVEGVVMAWWLLRWRRIRQLRPSMKRLMVVGCWSLTIANIVAFSIFVK